MDKLFEFFNFLGDKIFTEAGLVAGILFWFTIYFGLESRSVRKDNKALHEKNYNMGMAAIKANVEMQNAFDKMADTLDGVLTIVRNRKEGRYEHSRESTDSNDGGEDGRS